MMSIPESLEGLLANLLMCCCIHQKHTQQHNVTGNTTSFGVVDLESSDLSDLCLFDIEKTVVVSIGHLIIGKETHFT